MSNLYRKPSKYASYQISVHLGNRFRGEDYLEINQSETRIACGGHVCYWIGTKLAIFIENLPSMLPTKFRFIWETDSEEKIIEKSINQKQELPVAAMFVNGSKLNEQTL